MARTASKKKRIIIIAVVFAVIAALVLACALYLGDYYPAQLGAIEAMAPMERITVQKRRITQSSMRRRMQRQGSFFIPAERWNIPPTFR
jgi:hypothetical protein